MSADITIAGGSPLPIRPADTGSVAKASEGFGELIDSMIGEVKRQQQEGDAAAANLQTGDEKHLHQAIIAVEEADISLRMLVQMRNKALSAYEEIMRLQL
ncbi:MAG: flagellar hook-basal body complex protein FliE [Desulfopila sp.]